MENALVAGAARVGIEVQGGGLDLLRVTDNGRGIPAADVGLLFQRHATSKLQSAEQLLSIATLGFRGEALHSIAAAAWVTLHTRSQEEATGTAVEVRGGALRRREPLGAPVGTSVAVRHLFRDYPARLRFMKSPGAEAARIQGVVTTYALAFPEVAFRLSVEGREVFTSPGSGDPRDAAAAAYGGEVGQSLLSVAHAAPAGSPAVEGLVSPPDLSRANRSYISLFVNRRPVHHRSLTYALEESYHGFLAEGRHPIAILNITVAHEDVDVNVHPAKAEVRFQREHEVFRAVQEAVRRAVIAKAPVPSVDPGRLAVPPVFLGASPGMHAPARPAGARLMTSPRRQGKSGDDATVSPGAPPTPSATLGQTLPLLRVLGQMQSLYIVAEGPDGLYLVDQHAAHERVLYERLREASLRQAAETQGVLAPEAVELTPQQAQVLGSQAELLRRYGWDMEPFGERTYLIRAVPAVLQGRSPGQALLDLLDALLQETGTGELEEQLVASLACHAAVRAGETLAAEEMAELLRLLERAREPYTCPHGRPTVVHLSASHLEREFHRR
ncbi:MAG: DNA mismatch repair endonuclease MutL [Chloroflexi bacterium]|nr:DNA mismatch repair endonuclease MutL [Chloroflexota bacterium]